MSNTEIRKIVTESLVGMIAGVTRTVPPVDAPLPDFIQGPVDRAVERIATLLAQPDPQRQGEPVVLPERKDPTQQWHIVGGVAKAEGWNACLDEIAKLGPLYTNPAPAVQEGEAVAWYTEDHLTDKSATTWDSTVADRWRTKGWPVSQLYTHADAGEVERLREGMKYEGERAALCLEELQECESQRDEFYAEITGLRAQLAERDALLRDINKRHSSGVDFDLPADLAERVTALSASAEPIPFPGYPPVPEDRKLPAEPSAPVELDERAEFESKFVVQEGVFFSGDRNEYRSMNGRAIEETDAIDLNLRLSGWQARAALERKP